MLSWMLWLETAAAESGATWLPCSNAWNASATASGATPCSATTSNSECDMSAGLLTSGGEGNRSGVEKSIPSERKKDDQLLSTEAGSDR